MRIFHLGLCVNEPPHDGLRKGFLSNCTEYYELNCGTPNVNERAVQICRDYKPDLVFMQIQAEGIISIQTMIEMKATGAFVMNWTGDVRNDAPTWMVQANNHISVTCFSNMRDVKAVSGAEYLEIGYDPDIFCPEGPVTPVKPIVFFGNHYGDQFPLSRFRAEMVNYLKAHCDFGVYGNFPGSFGNFNSSQANEAAAYRSAKVAVNCSHYEIERYSSDRILRIMGTGTALCLAKNYPGIPFQDGVHLRTWNTLPELKNLCTYYTNPANEAERHEIARNGHEFVKANFSYEAMCRNIVEIYKRRK